MCFFLALNSCNWGVSLREHAEIVAMLIYTNKGFGTKNAKSLS